MMTKHRIRAEDVDWLDVDGEIVILDADRSVYLSINHTGAELWRRLSEGATADELAEYLVATYGIDLDRAHADVDQFISALLERDLVEPAE